MHRRIYFLIACAFIGIVVIASSIVLYRPTQATTKDCIDPDTVTECGLAKQTRVAIEATAWIQTVEALPSPTSVPTSAEPINIPSPEPLPTAVARQLEGEELTGKQFQGATSAWIAGSIRSVDPYEGIAIIVMSRPSVDKSPSYIAYAVDGIGISKEDHKKYTSYWYAPKEIGDITITNVTGIDGIVSFKTSTGVIGTFDLSKQVWSFK